MIDFTRLNRAMFKLVNAFNGDIDTHYANANDVSSNHVIINNNKSNANKVSNDTRHKLIIDIEAIKNAIKSTMLPT